MIDIQSISSGLVLRQDGIWYSSEEKKDISYPSDGHRNHFTIEDSSFWFKHRNNCIVCVVKAYPPEQDGTIFDIGGGNGFVSLGLINAGFNVVLVEPGQIGAYNAKQRGLKNIICTTIDTARFKSHSLHAVGLFDVAEHIDDDLSFFKSLRRLIKEGGRLYLTVPAYSFLWSEQDDSLGHFRRYTLNGICNLLDYAGFEVEFSSYIFRFLPIPIALYRALPYRIGLSIARNKTQSMALEHAANHRVTTKILDFLLNPEIKKLKRGNSMSFGGSCLVVARSP